MKTGHIYIILYVFFPWLLPLFVNTLEKPEYAHCLTERVPGQFANVSGKAVKEQLDLPSMPVWGKLPVDLHSCP